MGSCALCTDVSAMSATRATDAPEMVSSAVVEYVEVAVVNVPGCMRGRPWRLVAHLRGMKRLDGKSCFEAA